MKNILVTGGAGFIGSNFVHHLLARRTDVHVVTLDALTYAGVRENLNELPDEDRHTFVEGDICDSAAVHDSFKRFDIDTVVHFAAESHVDRSIAAPVSFVQTNVMGTFNLLEAARGNWMRAGLGGEGRRFHHVSTDEVYGRLTRDEEPFSEDTPYDPSSPYSASKAAADHFVRAYARTYGLSVTISNCSNNYGPRQLPEKLIPLVLMRALRGETIPVYGDGLQIRDWLYVEDHCDAIVAILERGTPGETYNIGGGNQPTNIEIVRTICRLLDDLAPSRAKSSRDTLIEHVEDRPGHDRRYAIDHSKITAELGWRPSESLESGLRKTVMWYLDNPDWVRAVTSRPDYATWLRTNYEARGVAE